MPRPRFSLLSLLLVTLLAASSAALVKNYPAWLTTDHKFKGNFVSKFSDDGQHIVLYSKNEIHILSSKTGGVENSIHTFKDIDGVDFHPENSSVLLISSLSKTLFCSTLWNWKTKTIVHHFPDHIVSRPSFEAPVFVAWKDFINQEFFLVPHDHLDRHLKVPLAPISGQFCKESNTLVFANSLGDFGAVDVLSGVMLYQSTIPEKISPSFERLLTISCIAKDLSRIAILAEKNLYICHARSGKLITTIPMNPISSAAIEFLPDNRLLMVSNDSSARAWNCDTGQLLASNKLNLNLSLQGIIGGSLFEDSELFATIGLGIRDGELLGYECHILQTQDFSLVKAFSNVDSFQPTLRGIFLKTTDNTFLDFDGKLPDFSLAVPDIRFVYGPWLNDQGTCAIAKSEPIYDETTFFIFSRHRPETWWGLAWLPEFWTTLVLASLFLWNLFRKPK